MSKERIAEQFKRLNETQGPVAEELREYVAAQNKTQKAILAALKDEPKTVPELAAECGLTSDTVLWFVTALRKYGKVSEIPGRVTYPKYQLANGEAK